ncbi:Sodium-coupled neutral amino acid transporter 9-like protein [Armadillidium nasatum]|uniref:Sodium-coupled neutral amino acid transporter 9-like protein n=1 Tax=Armadillidium nasatum TaxID=96803 RepID=A0A5N5TNX0_9CRUS|nr:Sodium-coupled neutral amino acid transporter 9-like protein [Armadillidium nasatum]
MERKAQFDIETPSEDDETQPGILHESTSMPILVTEESALLPGSSSAPRSYQRPFHLPPSRRISTEQDSHLYARFRYYSRLRAEVESHDHALVIPDHIVPPELFSFYIPGHSKEPDGKNPSHITIMSIWNTMMGTSLLTMPWAFGKAGFIGGLIIMICEGLICLITACKLLNLQKKMGLEGELYELNYLFRKLWPGSLGKIIEGVALAFSVVTLSGALVVYWILMCNFLYNTGEFFYYKFFGNITTIVTDDTVICPPNMTASAAKEIFSNATKTDFFHHLWQEDLTVPLYLLIPFIFLLNIKNTAIFSFFNSFGAISVIALFIFVIVKASGWGFHYSLTDPSDPFYVPFFQPSKSSFMALSGTLSLAYFLHNCVISILKSNRHPENVRDLTIGYFLVGVTYIPVGMIFYLGFPLPKFCIVDNFLDNFPPHNLALAVARLFLLFQMTTVYPLLNYFLRSQLLTYLFGPGAQHTWKQVTLINFVTLSLCVAFAIFYPKIGFILRWVGAISGLAYIFVLPPASDLQVHYNNKTLTFWRGLFNIIVIVLGFVNFGSQFFL